MPDRVNPALSNPAALGFWLTCPRPTDRGGSPFEWYGRHLTLVVRLFDKFRLLRRAGPGKVQLE